MKRAVLSLAALALLGTACLSAVGGTLLLAGRGAAMLASVAGLEMPLAPSPLGSGAGGVGAGTLRLPGVDPTDLDPALVRDVTSAEYVYEIHSGLATLSSTAEVIPDLAESWSVSDDGTVYTFTLRADASFHDGRPVTTADVAYSIDRACSPETASPVAETYLGDIVGCTDLLAGRASGVSGVSVIDDRRVAIRIDSPKSYFLAKLTYPTAFVVDGDQVEADAGWASRPNGTGPFRLAAYEPGELLRLERNELYHGTRARLEAVEFDLRPIDPVTRYENGELDAAPVGAADLERVGDPLNALHHELVEGPGYLGVTYIGLNTRVPPFDDPLVRRALAHAMDRERLVDVVLRGYALPADTILPPGMPAHEADANPYPYDPAAAMDALGSSRYGGPAGMPPLTLHVAGDAGDSPVAEAVADLLSEALGGVPVVVEQAPWDTFQRELDAGIYPMFMLGWSADYVDPQDFLDVLFHSRSPLNETGFSDAAVDELLEAARIERDEERRLDLYRRAEKRILAAAPWVPLFGGGDAWLVGPHVRGFDLPAIVRPRLADVWIASE